VDDERRRVPSYLDSRSKARRNGMGRLKNLRTIATERKRKDGPLFGCRGLGKSFTCVNV